MSTEEKLKKIMETIFWLMIVIIILNISDECFVILDNFAELVKEYFEKGFEKIINLTFKLEDLLIELE